MSWAEGDYNADVSPSDESPRIFTLAEACELLPVVQRVTEDAVVEADALASRIEALTEDDPARDAIQAAWSVVVHRWAGQLREIGVEVKGLWLADFDNDQGYYCWKYPEARLSHYHGYEDGFAGRMTIV